VPTNPAARCVQHGLVVAPDGLCVLCRRQAAGVPGPAATPPEVPHVAPIPAYSTPPAARASLGVIGLSALLLMAAAGGAWGWKYASGGLAFGGEAASSAHASPEPRALAIEPLADAQSALDQAKAQDLAASLKLLERGEAERQERERLQDAQDAQRRSGADATRKQEELARDAARHKAVMHDLEQLGLEQARHNVQITMYSTDWCGVCKRAREYMRSRTIPFTEHDIDHDDAARARAHALNAAGSVPTITIDRELLIGFSAESLEERIARAARKRKL
jgi:glutaredoxin